MRLSIAGGYINHVTADANDDVNESVETNNDAEDRYVVWDATPPTLTVDAITAPEDGFLQEKTIAVSDVDALGTSPVQVSGSITDNRRIPIETNVTVDVNGTGATINTEGTWTVAIPLSNGPNLINVSATDLAGNSTSTAFELVLDMDLDDDGIYNNIDTLPYQDSILFSDSVLGGNTSGNVEPANPNELVEFLIEDASEPEGLVVDVEDLSGDVKIDLDCSTGSYLFGPGTYVLTCNTVTLEVVTGIAQVEFSIGETTLLVVIQADSTVHLVETTAADGELLELNVTIERGAVTVNGVPVNQGQSLNLTPPIPNAGGPYSVDEGSVTVLDASGSSDPNGGTVSATWDLDNDGSFETQGLSPTFSAVILDGPSTQVVVVEVCNIYGMCVTDQSIVDIQNVAPTIDSITAPVDPVAVNTEINVSATFTDPGTGDTHTAVWNWGDGNTSEGIVNETNGSGNVSGSHTYTEAGVYIVEVTIIDDDGGEVQSKFQSLVIYDPGAGFVTGGGWINSPEGAYVPDPMLSGKATFGFVSKYKKGQTTPTGNTEFQFKAGDLNFHSKNYDWLVIAGHKAMYKGTGTINGVGEYDFTLSAIDASLTPNTDVDLFHIKIWDKATGDVIYDNQIGASENKEPTTAIGGGNIVIHIS